MFNPNEQKEFERLLVGYWSLLIEKHFQLSDQQFPSMTVNLDDFLSSDIISRVLVPRFHGELGHDKKEVGAYAYAHQREIFAKLGDIKQSLESRLKAKAVTALVGRRGLVTCKLRGQEVWEFSLI